MIIRVPVYTSSKRDHICVEVQIRTIAMDFWASLEHKIFYKYERNVPAHLLEELTEAAHSAAALDNKMEKLHMEMLEVKQQHSSEKNLSEVKLDQLRLNNETFKIPQKLIEQLQQLPDK